MNKNARPGKREATIRLLGAMLLAILPAPAPAPAAPDSGRRITTTLARPDEAARHTGMSMETWKAQHEEAEAAMHTPSRRDRIKKCEAFLSAHPEYPEFRTVLSALVEAELKTADYSPKRVAQQVERLAEPKLSGTRYDPLGLVERYGFKYHLPLDSAQRLVRMAGAALEQETRDRERDPDPKARARNAQMLEWWRIRLLLSEGRVLLAKGDARGALPRLLEARERQEAPGESLTVRQADGSVIRTLPRCDWLMVRTDVSLAQAYSMMGDLASARKRFESIMPGASSDMDLLQSISEVRSKVGLASPQFTEIRGAPTPARDFSLADLQGGTASLSDFKDRVLMLYLWSMG